MFLFNRTDGIVGRSRSQRARRSRTVRSWLNIEELEPRIVLSLTWTTLGEGSVTGNTVMMGVAGRLESGQQSQDFHGAYAKLPAAKSYQIPFTYNLSTWDSYNASFGYWDSFSVSITTVPYPQLNLLQDPIQFPFVWGGAEWGGGVLQKNTGSTTISATFNVAAPHYLNVILDTKTLPTADNNYPSWGTVQVITGSLGIVTDNGSELSNDQNQSPGGYVAVNNEDADYNGTPDLSQAGPIMGEADLVPLDLNPVDPVAQGGTYTLANLSPNLKIYMNSDKSDPVTNATTFDATKANTVYVEGIAESSGKAKEEIDLNWTNGTLSATLDKVKYTVYKVTGPMDVPDYSIYTYKADIPGGGTGSWTATNGTVQTGANANTSTILWGGGPVVGDATFSPAPGFSVDYAVNVVQVKIDISGTNSLTYNNPPSQSGTTALIASTTAGAAETSTLGVATLAGPMVNGSMRGVKFIQLGMIQNGQFTAKHAVYDGLAPAQIRKSSLEDGTYHLDYLTSAGQVSTSPWYDSQAGTGSLGFLAPTTDTQQNNIIFNVSDTPQLLATDMPVLNGIQANLYAIVFDLNLYFAVRTTEAVNGSDQVYTQRAKASWRFDGTGTVNAAGIWSQTGTGTTGSAKFTEVQSGDVVPITTGTPINNLFPGETWTTVNK
jgi:hypothetical protein